MRAQRLKHVLALCSKALRKVTVKEVSQLTCLSFEHISLLVCAC